MVITTRFELSAPIEAAWAYLLDVPKIAHCVPGASLTEVIDDKTYEGKVEVKLGPIGLTFGRARLWNALPGRFSFEIFPELHRVSHPLRQPAAYYRTYARLWHAVRDSAKR